MTAAEMEPSTRVIGNKNDPSCPAMNNDVPPSRFAVSH